PFTPDVLKHRHYRSLADRIELKNSPEGFRMLESMHERFVDKALNNPEPKIPAMSMASVGYHDWIAPKASVVAREVEVEEPGYTITRLTLKDRFGTEFTAYHGRPAAPSKGVVLALHGGTSDPRYVMGLSENEDYNRNFG